MRPVRPINVATLVTSGPVNPFGNVALVDADQLELSALAWRVHRSAGGNRAVRCCPPVMLASKIFGDMPEGFKIGFANNNTMDCRRENLVAIPARQRTKRGCWSKRMSGGGTLRKQVSSRFHGVSFYPATRKWRASCFDGAKCVHVGYFPFTTDGEISAAHAVDDFARKTFGDCAGLNFPE
jgi:hypothetical protein